MRSTPDTPIDSLGSLGSPIKPQPAPTAAPVPIGNGCVRNPDGTLATNAPPPAPVRVYTPPAAVPTAMPVISDGQAEDWEGLCLDPYSRALLGAI